MINLNSAASWFHSDELEEMDGAATVVPRTSELMNIQAVTQLEKDTILVCYDSEWSHILLNYLNSFHKSNYFASLSDVVKVVNIQGKLKSSKRQSSELHFDFTITAIGECLSRSVSNMHKFPIHIRH